MPTVTTIGVEMRTIGKIFAHFAHAHFKKSGLELPPSGS